MAFFNEILTGRHNEALRKLFNLRGRSPSPQLAPEITPEVVLEDADDPETRYLVGWRLAAANQFKAAVTTDFSFVGLENPPSSGALIVVEWLGIFLGNVLVKHLFGIGPAGPTGRTGVTVNSDFNRDRRGTIGATRGQPDNGSNLVAFTNQSHVSLAANQSIPIQEVLQPGETLVVEGNVVNIAVQAWFLWRERHFETSEV